MAPRFLARRVDRHAGEMGSGDRRAGKTLLEMIVVLGIIAGLLGLYLPTILKAWHAVDRFR